MLKKEKVDLYHQKTNQLHFEIIFADVIKTRNANEHSIYLTNELEYELFKKDPLAYCNAVSKK
jgi:L-rhamnose mutarotase